MTQEAATVWGFWVAVAALCVSAVGFFIAVLALRRSNLNSSGAVALTLMVSFRDAWDRFLNADASRRDFEFHELMNLIEAACAIHRERSLVGKSGDLIEKYLTDILGYLENDAGAREQIEAMRHQPHTFEHRDYFLRKTRKKGRLTIIADLVTAPAEAPVVPAPVEAANAP